MAKESGVDSHARQLARALLQKHKVLQPPTPLQTIVKAEGLQVTLRSWGKQSRLDALLFRSHGLIAVNCDKPPLRQRFSLAHELGHYALNHEYLKLFGPDIDIDHPPEDSHPTNVKFESEANDFAGELLVPRALLMTFRSKRDDAEDEDAKESFRPFADLGKRLRARPLSEQELASKFRVSKEVIFIALQKSGLL
jgi:Zn-dependent peptidase ImmA (M78 family)